MDIEGAKKLLRGAPEVRIMYNKDNPNHVDAYSLISESATKAGFKIVDGGLGKSDWGRASGSGGYDAALFGWATPVSACPAFRRSSGPAATPTTTSSATRKRTS